MGIPERHLAPLHELGDYIVAADDPDPRGWDVTTTDGRPLGRVDDLVVDTDAMRARYLDVKVAPSVVPAADSDRHVLVPASAVRIGDRERNEARIRLAVPPELLASVAVPAVPTADALTAYDQKWPVIGEGACDVRVIRGGRHG